MSNKPIQEAIANGTIHPEFRKENLHVAKLVGVYDPDYVCWAICEKEGRKLKPIGNEEEMFRYDTEEDAQEELDLLNLWQAEGVGNA